MAFGFIKKVFSFGRKEVVEEKPDETAPLPPLNFEALKPVETPALDAPAEPAPEIRPEPAPETEPAPPTEQPVTPETPPTTPQEVPPEPARPEPETPEPTPPEIPSPAPEAPQPPTEVPPSPPQEAPAPQPVEIPIQPEPPPAEAPVEVPAPTLASPPPRLRGEGKGEGPHQPLQEAALPAASPIVSPEAASDGTAPHPLPDLIPAGGEKGAVASPPPTPHTERKESGKVTVSKKVEQKAEPAKTPEPVQPKKSWFQRMREGLARSSRELTGNIAGVFTKRKLDEDTLQDLEDILIRADLGVETALRVTDSLASSRYGKTISDEEVRGVMAEEIGKVLTPVALPLELDLSHKPHVILVVGVNGTGKTTTIGKLAAKLTAGGLSVMLAAGDTFRAAAIEQLKIWGERTHSPVVATKLGADAAGLAYDAFEKAKEAGSDVLIIDTAGRLQNKAELMAELEKIVRVLGKLDPEAPHTVLQTVDATTGQNALNQVEIFRNVAGVNGLVMTKLDGTARGGILVAIAAKHRLPVYFIGVGEQVDDLEPFAAGDFARAIAGVA